MGLLFPALFAYAHYLEDEMCLEEALDVLETLERVGGDKYRAEDQVAARLRTARVLRKLNRFDEAEQGYGEAGALAEPIGDSHSLLLSRIGRAESLRGRGNLAEAEQSLRGGLAAAEAAADEGAQALAHQCLAVVLSTSGRPAEAIPHEWRAYELYDDAISRMRTLTDLGVMFLTVGDARSADLALTTVVREGTGREVVDNAMIELMHCASFRRDRVGFERWRERCEARRDDMPPNVLVDFTLKVGIGRARFGQIARANALLRTALRLAEEAGLHEFVFRIERIKDGLRDCKEGCSSGPLAAAESVFDSDGLREVSNSLALLAR